MMTETTDIFDVETGDDEDVKIKMNGWFFIHESSRVEFITDIIELIDKHRI